MKFVFPLFAIICFSLVSCETMTSPIASDGFDPMRAPGTNSTTGTAGTTTFTAGQFVQASLDNTAFFKNRPKGDADADRLLKKGTSMKVISNSNSYVKVELDSGEVGFVPAIMLEDPKATAAASTRPGEYQVYPPIPGSGPVAPLPSIDPATLPPEGAIPTVIDPEAPSTFTPPPSGTPATVPPAEPRIEESVPLPPNGEEKESR